MPMDDRFLGTLSQSQQALGAQSPIRHRRRVSGPKRSPRLMAAERAGERRASQGRAYGARPKVVTRNAASLSWAIAPPPQSAAKAWPTQPERAESHTLDQNGYSSPADPALLGSGTNARFGADLLAEHLGQPIQRKKVLRDRKAAVKFIGVDRMWRRRAFIRDGGCLPISDAEVIFVCLCSIMDFKGSAIPGLDIIISQIPRPNNFLCL